MSKVGVVASAGNQNGGGMSAAGDPLKSGDLPPRYMHPDDMEWELLRFEGQHSKMVFHPSEANPTEPNVGLVRYAPGSSHPLHRHDFAQVWYILEGDFTIGDKRYRQGTLVFHADPHFEEELRTDTGGVILYVQYEGPTTGGRPIYDGRFNMTQRKPLSQERLDI